MSNEALAVAPVVQETPTAAVEAVENAAPSEAIEKKEDAPADDTVNQDQKANENKKEPTEVEKIRYSMQKRIDRLTARNSEMERKYQEAIQSLEKYKQPEANKAAPKETDFETTEDYLKAVGKFEAEQEFAKQQKAKEAEQQQKTYAEKLAAKKAEFEAKEAEIRKTTPDYDDAVSVLNEYVELADKESDGFSVFRDVLMESNDMAAMSYHLGKNPDLLESMTKMTPAQIARTLFRLEYDLEKAPAKQATQHQQPTPPKPSSGSTKSQDKSLRDLSYAEMKKRMKL